MNYYQIHLNKWLFHVSKAIGPTIPNFTIILWYKPWIYGWLWHCFTHILGLPKSGPQWFGRNPIVFGEISGLDVVPWPEKKLPMTWISVLHGFFLFGKLQYSMAISGTGLLEVPTIYKAYTRPIFSGLNFREYPQKFWPKIWYIYVPPSVGSWRSPKEINAIVLLFLMGLFRNWLPKFRSLYLGGELPTNCGCGLVHPSF